MSCSNALRETLEIRPMDKGVKEKFNELLRIAETVGFDNFENKKWQT